MRERDAVPVLLHQVVKFHPNGNYVATGSCDKSIRLWDILNGHCVRIFTGHKAATYSLAFSSDGKLLASAGMYRLVHTNGIQEYKCRHSYVIGP